MERPIETRSLGEVVATSVEVREIAPGVKVLVFCFDEWGHRYERIRVITTADMLQTDLAMAGSGPPSHLQ